jgi:hexosaminidase
VVVNWHYGAEASFEPYIQTIARGGFAQMVAPGASNWNEIFPNVTRALANEGLFINEGKAARVLGLFETVWHDDGETLYEATWYPVIYAAAAAWQGGNVTPEQFASDFPSAFFGVDDSSYSANVQELGRALLLLEPAGDPPPNQTNSLFWGDVFDPELTGQVSAVAASSVRLTAESVEQDRYFSRPPLHANAAFVMFLAARRYDALARKVQIAREVQAMYADALTHASTDRDATLRDLLWCRYWMWELRDAYEGLASLYERAWRYESRDGHLPGNLERYHLAAQKAIDLGDAFYRASRRYERSKSLPPFDKVVSP